MDKRTISLGADHAGVHYKDAVKAYLIENGFSVRDFGTDSDESVDYPDFVHPAAESVKSGESELGLLFCGSANGVSMTANKHQEIRAAIAWQKDIAALARQHNNANMLAIPCRFVAKELAIDIVSTFLATEFEGGRHQRRVGKIACC